MCYVRFDDAVTELGEGISVFGSRDGKVFRDCSCNLKPRELDHREGEATLRQASIPGCPYRI